MNRWSFFGKSTHRLLKLDGPITAIVSLYLRPESLCPFFPSWHYDVWQKLSKGTKSPVSTTRIILRQRIRAWFFQNGVCVRIYPGSLHFGIYFYALSWIIIIVLFWSAQLFCVYLSIYLSNYLYIFYLLFHHVLKLNFSFPMKHPRLLLSRKFICTHQRREFFWCVRASWWPKVCRESPLLLHARVYPFLICRSQKLGTRWIGIWDANDEVHGAEEQPQIQLLAAYNLSKVSTNVTDKGNLTD